MPYAGRRSVAERDAPAARGAAVRHGGAARVLAARPADLVRGHRRLPVPVARPAADPGRRPGRVARRDAAGRARRRPDRPDRRFLWLERLPLRPGLGIAAMLALALAGALPLASAADGEDPWFDYKSFAEGFGPGRPAEPSTGATATARWTGRARARRCCASRRPGRRTGRCTTSTTSTASSGSTVASGSAASDPELELAGEWRTQAGWRETLRVTLRRMQTRDVLGAGHDARRARTPRGSSGTCGRAGRVAIAERVPRRRLLHRPGLRPAARPRRSSPSRAPAPTRAAPPTST